MTTDLALDGWMVAWNPDYGDGCRIPLAGNDLPVGAVQVGPWPDETGWSDAYDYTDGCCELDRLKQPRETQLALVFITFHTLVVRDGIGPQAAHREFLKIAEYRNRISPDIEGAAP